MSVLQCSLKSNRNILNVWMLGSITEICYFSFETKDMLFFIWMLYKMCTKTSLPLCSFVVNEFIKKERKRFFFSCWWLLLFSLWVLSWLWPHGLQHSRLPCPSLFSGICSNSCSLSWWCYLTIWSTVAFFLLLPSIFPSIIFNISNESVFCWRLLEMYGIRV